MKKTEKKLVLANGDEFIGYSFGFDGDAIAELCFNTSMVGYQEIMSDPSYGGQMLVMTYPIIGSYGINDYDYESKKPAISAFVVDNYIDFPSNFRSKRTFSQELTFHKVVGIYGIDTRMITKIMREQGSQNAIITSIDTPKNEALAKLRAWKFPKDIIEQVSRKTKEQLVPNKVEYTIVAIDHGIKENILRNFLKRNCKVIVLPYGATASQVLSYNPDGLFLSNGPGDPENAIFSVKLVQDIKGKVPIFGICLGQQIIALAYGAKTKKMIFGHRGGNHPVKNIITNKVDITTQNHSYEVDEDSLENTSLEITHINIHDNTLEGLQDKLNYLMCVQYHPEAAAGPEDPNYLFDDFILLINKWKESK